MEDGQKQPEVGKKIKFRSNLLHGESYGWLMLMTVLSFFMSIALLLLTYKVFKEVSTVISLGVVLGIIIFGIIFDIIGIAVAAADETPFHALASRRIKGAKQAIRLIRNANKVSAFCNDVIGDICGVISGTTSTIIIVSIVGESHNAETTPIGLVISGIVAALTVGGKATGKTVAIKYSNYIVYKVSVLLYLLLEKTSFLRKKKKKAKKLKEG